MSEGEPLSGPDRRKILAYALPMLVFIAPLGLGSALKVPGAPLWRSAPEFWIYPLQTLLCAGLLVYFRREYEFQPLRRPVFTIGVALLVFVLWIAPQEFLHFPARLTGFNPDTFAGTTAQYWTTLALRFLRLVLVVPLVEELFWRGFLLRFLIAERFQSVPFGSFSWLSFTLVMLAFGFSHAIADWPAAFITGALYNVVAYRTKSLTSCVLAHSLTNLVLGLWIMSTKQWGFW
ncbi:MAG: CAAX prenyl protease-related protein [Chthoniobacterales bacterium]